MVTAVVFSITLVLAVAPPPLLSMTGAVLRVRARLSMLVVMPTALPCNIMVPMAMALLVPEVRYTVRATTSAAVMLT